MNVIEEMVARKNDAISKSEEKLATFETNIERKRRIISDLKSKIASVEAGIEEKQAKADEQAAFIEGQQASRDRVQQELDVWVAADEKLDELEPVFEEFSSVVRLSPKAKRDGTEVEGYTYDKLIAEMERLRRIKVDAESNAKAIFWGKR